MQAVNLRAGWLLGNVQGRYIYGGAGGIQIVGGLFYKQYQFWSISVMESLDQFAW